MDVNKQEGQKHETCDFSKSFKWKSLALNSHAKKVSTARLTNDFTSSNSMYHILVPSKLQAAAMLRLLSRH